MVTLTKRQRDVAARRELILSVVRGLFIEGGYHGLTMARVAERAGYSKGTVYDHFSCKEEAIIALAAVSVEKQRVLVERAATFPGRSRERMLAVAEATQLFARLYPDDTRIFQIMNGEAITQKGSKESLWRLRLSANHTVAILRGIIRDAVAQGDLAFEGDRSAEDLVFHLWLLGEAGKATVSSWMPPTEMGVEDTFGSLIRSSQVLVDAYGWRPLSSEWDYGETMRRIREEVFGAESKEAYGT